MADREQKNDFAAQATQDRSSLAGEFLDYLKDNKKWWLAPILIVTLLLIGLVFLTASPAAPFIYTLF